MNTLYLLFFLVFLGFYLVLFLVLLFSNQVDRRSRAGEKTNEDHYKEEILQFKA